MCVRCSEAVMLDCVLRIQKQLRSTACYVYRPMQSRSTASGVFRSSYGLLRVKCSEAVTVDCVLSVQKQLRSTAC